ncbi:hypothetical protein [Hamadaea tsunoensis]|uniref:hypothetical protein n=1 Tax=Hamadaea tsunoensis TaxID=53368 RepID=UPI0004071279|nr:hypothetical protein [Hamadaea tsunoensis]
MGTALTIVAIVVGVPVAGSLLMFGGVLGGRAAMRTAIAEGRARPSCPNSDCPFRAESAIPVQRTMTEQVAEPTRSARED